MSMNPGATTWPAASITRAASPESLGATATIRSPSTATSAARAGAPEPSTSEPFRTRRDQATLLFGDGDRGHLVALLDAVDVLHAGHDAAEHRVLTVQVRCRAVADVELAAGRVRILTARHRQRPAHVLLLVELRLDLVAGAAGAIALRAAALDDEVRHDPMEVEAVVEPFLGQRDEVLDGLGRIFGVELESDLAALLERDDANLLHDGTLLSSP